MTSMVDIEKKVPHLSLNDGGTGLISRQVMYHRPVLIKEVLSMLNPSRGGIYLDATVGMGGHAMAILELLDGGGLLICADRDEEALRISMERLKVKEGSPENHRIFWGANNVVFVKSKFSELPEKLDSLGISGLDGAVFDFGVSFYQLKSDERGFGFYSDARLDMRMDRSSGITAWDVVNTYPEERLLRIIKEYGEEPMANRIVRAILRQRSKSPINSPKVLAQLIEKTVGRRGRLHPATRTFQAIRIEVNNELDEIRNGISSVFELLNKNGRLVVISYHSLEDRIVKHIMRNFVKRGKAELLTKKPITPSDEEIKENPSSRSAKLRGVKRL